MFKRLVVLILFAIATVSVSTSAHATTHAAITPMGVEALHVEYQYYSTSAKTVLVGEDIFLCNGLRYTWGQKTPYYTKHTEACEYP